MLAIPLVAPQLVIADYRGGPDWERDRYTAFVLISAMAKNAAAALTALTGVVLYALLCAVGCGGAAAPAVVVTLLGSNLWMTASQSPWAHGGAALGLTVALLLLATPRPRSTSLVGAGLALGVMVCCRPQDLVFAAGIAGVVAVWQGRRATWFLAGPIVLGALQVGWNLQEFGSVLGGYAELRDVIIRHHAVDGPWAASPWPGMAGTLFSPSRGLLVFSPWVIVAVASLPATWSQLRPFPALGAFTFPSTWNSEPTNVNVDVARVWDWHDSELTRALEEGPRSWAPVQVWRQITLSPPGQWSPD